MSRRVLPAIAALATALVLGTATTPAAGAASTQRPEPGRSPSASVEHTSSTAPSPTPTPSVTAAPARWAPRLGTTWQVQYAGALNTSFDVEVYDLDGFDVSASTVSTLRASGRRAICYFSAGSWEDWRPDAWTFPAAVLGRSNGWPGERWLDIRQLEVLKPILSARIRMCRDKGFAAVDPDNMDGYTNSTGFPLSAADQLAFNRWIAAEAHAHGLSVGLKNDLDQIPELVDDFDFAVNEQCVEYRECGALTPFTASGKAVLHVEYAGDPASYCPTTTRLGLSSLRKRLSLSAYRRAC